MSDANDVDVSLNDINKDVLFSANNFQNDMIEIEKLKEEPEHLFSNSDSDSNVTDIEESSSSHNNISIYSESSSEESESDLESFSTSNTTLSKNHQLNTFSCKDNISNEYARRQTDVIASHIEKIPEENERYACSIASSSTEQQQLQRFPSKLWEAVNDPNSQVVTWTSGGTELLINPEKFNTEVMEKHPRLVQVPRFENMRRQMREYGFSWRETPNGEYIFSHGKFVKHCPDLLSEVKTRRRRGLVTTIKNNKSVSRPIKSQTEKRASSNRGRGRGKNSNTTKKIPSIGRKKTPTNPSLFLHQHNLFAATQSNWTTAYHPNPDTSCSFYPNYMDSQTNPHWHYYPSQGSSNINSSDYFQNYVTTFGYDVNERSESQYQRAEQEFRPIFK